VHDVLVEMLQAAAAAPGAATAGDMATDFAAGDED